MNHVSLPDESSRRTTLGELGDVEPGAAPMLILAGRPLAERSDGVVPDLMSSEIFQNAVGLE
jgi:hypothetical protein